MLETLGYIAVMAGVTYLIRVLPLTLIRRQITNPWLKSFLHYIPYVTLSVMTFPSILHSTGSEWTGLAALVVAMVLAWRGAGLFAVAVAACMVVFGIEWLLIP